MIGVITGHLGTGKTLFLTYLAKWANESDVDIYANFNIGYDAAEVVDVHDLEDIENGLLLMDEAYTWLDSRTSMSERNRYLSKMIFKSRKRKLDMFATAQLESSIDLRMRHLKDARIHAMGTTPNQEAFKYILKAFGVTKKFYLPMSVAEELFDRYDTYEYPDQKPNQFTPNKMDRTLEGIVDKFKQEYDEPEELTKGMIGDQMLEWGINQRKAVERVYHRIKRLNKRGELYE